MEIIDTSHTMSDGILIIDKPEGITSHDVVNKVRRALNTRRVGHTGTLDPFATGVMVVLVGKATRLAQFLDKDEKEYEATIRFGFETETGDRTGEVRGPKAIDLASLSSIEWEPVLEKFRGEIEQIPPMYSAKKIQGRKLYEHARKGIEIEREPISINIKELELVDDRDITGPAPTLRIRVVCSAGTYIRVLAEDIGREVGAGAHLAELRRTRSGRFSLDEAITLEQLDLAESADPVVLSLNRAVEHLPVFTLTMDRVEKTLNGLSTRVPDSSFADAANVQMVNEDGQLISVGVYDAESGSVRPKVILV